MLATTVAIIVLGSCCAGALGTEPDRTVQNDGACAVTSPLAIAPPPIQDHLDDDDDAMASLWTAYAGWTVGVVLIWAVCALVVRALVSADGPPKKAPRDVGPLRRLWGRIPLFVKAPVVLLIVFCMVLPHLAAEALPLAVPIIGLACRIAAAVMQYACLFIVRMAMHGQRCAALALVNIAMRAVLLAVALIDFVL